MQIDDIIRQMLPKKRTTNLMCSSVQVRVDEYNSAIDACEAKLKAGLRIEAVVCLADDGSVIAISTDHKDMDDLMRRDCRTVTLLAWEEK